MSESAPVLSALRFSHDGEPVSAGTEIFREGEVGDCMFVVQEGEIDITIEGAVIETVGPGGVLGEMALIDSGPRSATARVRRDGAVVRIDRARFQFLVQQHPFFALDVMRIMAHRLRHMNERLTHG